MDFDDFVGFQLIDFDGFALLSMDFNGFQWISLDCIGFRWIPSGFMDLMDFDGV